MKNKLLILSFSLVVVFSFLFLFYFGPISIRHHNMSYDRANVAEIASDFDLITNTDNENVAASLASRARRSTNKAKVAPVKIPTLATTTDTSTVSVVKEASLYNENFNTNFTVKESGSIEKSGNEDWWISSGAYLIVNNGIGSTVQGLLSTLDPWRVAYYVSNTLDTDEGYHPQNIFRLVNKNKWLNYSQESYFRVIKDNLSTSPNRNASNGILHFNRYQDAFNLYYTGVRVDGYAVIKKKINGIYFTMAYKKIIQGGEYDKNLNPNQITKNTWIGMRSVLSTNEDDTVSIKLYTDIGKTGNWVLAAEATDDGKSFGGPAFHEGHTGIRTDFMDVQFDDYLIKSQ